MDVTPYVERLRRELAVAAEAGGDEARALAERLTAPLESAVRLTLLNALSTAMSEVTRELAPGSVDVRLRGLDPEFVVTTPAVLEQPPALEPPPAARPPAPADADDSTAARINFRLPAHLKARVEEAAGRDSLSVNAWLVRAVATALEPAGPDRSGGRNHSDRGFTGWVR
jgi:hypothetical protein